MKNILRDRSEKLNRPLVLDGAMGSLLQMRKFPVDGPLWSATANVIYPNEVRNIHKEYLDAQADIITTNTFRTNPYAVKLSGIDQTSTELVRQAITLAREATRNGDVIIAGSNAPAEDCYKTDRKNNYGQLNDNHAEHIELLHQNGVDIIWNETFSHSDEIEIVSKYCASKSIPYVINLFVDNNLKLLSGESYTEIIKLLHTYQPLAIGINCISLNTFANIMNDVNLGCDWGFYLNCGSGNYTDSEIRTGIYPGYYINEIKDYLKYKPLYIGTCCGSTPEHTYKIKEYILAIYSD